MKKEEFENAQFGDIYTAKTGEKAVWLDDNTLVAYSKENGLSLIDESSVEQKIGEAKKEKDPFDYESITEENAEEFKDFEKRYESMEKYGYRLTKTEYARYLKFCENHSHEEVNRGAIGGGTVVSFMGTGLGNVVHCTCTLCSQTADITDFDCW